jgi:NAD(P)-dependent dehydrogenase (short-subunit alcohol dehydrogenase family)
MEEANMFDITGKTALVTGGGSGLGREMALTLARFGAEVVIADLNFQAADAVKNEICALGRKSLSTIVNITSSDDVQKMIARVIAELGKIDILINSAGILARNVTGHDFEVWRKIIEVNLTGTFLVCSIVGEYMVKANRGTIINVASMSGSIVNKRADVQGEPGLPGTAAYCASKAGVKHLTKVLAAAWAANNVRVNSISPGYMNTAVTAKGTGNPLIRQNMEKMTPMGRVGEPSELKGAVIYLASDASSYVTGHDLVIDGGYTCW